jgi:hypothetical protein
MSIPLDQLYNFLDGISDHNLLIYRWYPHGSRKLEHLLPLKDYAANGKVYFATHPIMICHDQEPLALDQMDSEIFNNLITQWKNVRGTIADPPPSVIDFFKTRKNLRQIDSDLNVYDYIILLHSELNSLQVEQSRDQYVPVYYWSHALISRDWFRYAKLDPILNGPKHYTHDFLIYNRAWSGTREYRLKFAELLINEKLDLNCKMGFSSTDTQVNYKEHIFKNSALSIDNKQIHEHFFDNQAPSEASADYSANDYQSCAIEVVLETLFDDSRHHLTEKSLRPIACGQPFILAATAGSLAYLRSYGFKTFGSIIDESYDLIENPVMRLNAIVKIMKDIAHMPTDAKTLMVQNLKEIAKYNQERFFSNDFQNQVIQEFKTNLDIGMKTVYQNCTGRYLREKLTAMSKNNNQLWPRVFSRQECAEIWKWVHNHNQILTRVPSQSADGA